MLKISREENGRDGCLSGSPKSSGESSCFSVTGMLESFQHASVDQDKDFAIHDTKGVNDKYSEITYACHDRGVGCATALLIFCSSTAVPEPAGWCDDGLIGDEVGGLCSNPAPSLKELQASRTCDASSRDSEQQYASRRVTHRRWSRCCCDRRLVRPEVQARWWAVTTMVIENGSWRTTEAGGLKGLTPATSASTTHLSRPPRAPPEHQPLPTSWPVYRGPRPRCPPEQPSQRTPVLASPSAQTRRLIVGPRPLRRQRLDPWAAVCGRSVALGPCEQARRIAAAGLDHACQLLRSYNLSTRTKSAKDTYLGGGT